MQEPIEPRPPKVTPEPEPLFALQFHDTTHECERGHTYSCESWRRRLRRFREQVQSGERLSIDYVEKVPPCPHCQRDEWSDANRHARGAHQVALQNYRREKQRWDELGELEGNDLFGLF